MAQGFLIGKDKREEVCKNEYYKWGYHWNCSIFARPVPKAPAIDDLLFQVLWRGSSRVAEKEIINTVYLGQQLNGIHNEIVNPSDPVSDGRASRITHRRKQQILDSQKIKTITRETPSFPRQKERNANLTSHELRIQMNGELESGNCDAVTGPRSKFGLRNFHMINSRLSYVSGFTAGWHTKMWSRDRRCDPIRRLPFRLTQQNIRQPLSQLVLHSSIFISFSPRLLLLFSLVGKFFVDWAGFVRECQRQCHKRRLLNITRRRMESGL